MDMVETPIDSNNSPAHQGTQEKLESKPSSWDPVSMDLEKWNRVQLNYNQNIYFSCPNLLMKFKISVHFSFRLKTWHNYSNCLISMTQGSFYQSMDSLKITGPIQQSTLRA